jgi:AraC-like DNA-binding protein
MQAHIVSGYRQFDRPDEWFDAISPFFVGARPAQRTGRFLLGARVDSFARSTVFNVDIHQSGLDPGRRGFSIESVAAHRYFALWQRSGSSAIEQAHRQVKLTAGNWALFDASLPCSFNVLDGSRIIGLMIPERDDSRWDNFIRPGGCEPVYSNDGDMAAILLIEASCRSAGLDPRAQQSFETLLIDLLDSALERDQHRSDLDSAMTKLPAELRRAGDYIVAELGNVALQPDDIGNAIGVSRSTLHRMFRAIGHTPTSYVLRQRLQEAARRLRDAKAADLTITGIAFDLGFTDPAHFGRLFHRQYGLSPQEWRIRNKDD